MFRVVALILVVACQSPTSAGGHASEPLSTGPSLLAQKLQEVQGHTRTPGIAAAVIENARLTDVAAVGVRKTRDPTPITTDDPFHLGSCTKAFTATLAAMLVEDGVVSWDTRLRDVFPELGSDLHVDYRDVTLEMLLRHQGGAPASLEAHPELWVPLLEPGDPMVQRDWLATRLISAPPESPPNAEAVYSNAGYLLAGTILERATGTSWESLVTARIFEPLEMTGCGFGAPGTPGQVDAPWGHTAGPFGGMVSLDPGSPTADNPPMFGPAGTIHCSLPDWSRFVTAHLRGARGDETLLTVESWRKLHDSADQEYALGWIGVNQGWAGGTALTHTGSNTRFYAVAWIAPRRNAAWLVATNRGDGEGYAAMDEVMTELVMPTPW